MQDLTRGTKRAIFNAIEKTGKLNKSVLREEVCNMLCDKFQGDALDYQLERMKLEKVSDVDKAIDRYIFNHLEVDILKNLNLNKKIV